MPIADDAFCGAASASDKPVGVEHLSVNVPVHRFSVRTPSTPTGRTQVSPFLNFAITSHATFSGTGNTTGYCSLSMGSPSLN